MPQIERWKTKAQARTKAYNEGYSEGYAHSHRCWEDKYKALELKLKTLEGSKWARELEIRERLVRALAMVAESAAKVATPDTF